MKHSKKFFTAVIAVTMCVALSISAFAQSAAEEMADNSAAWWVAYEAGDMETCDALHEANVAIAESLGGSEDTGYDEETGAWDFETSDGGSISSSYVDNGKSSGVSYAYENSSGGKSTSTSVIFSDESIAAYQDYGGTTDGVYRAYNQTAGHITITDKYGNDLDKKSANAEIAVIKACLNLSDAELSQLQAKLVDAKGAYNDAEHAYELAMKEGRTADAAAAIAEMNAANDKAQAARAEYGYSGNKPNAADGGYLTRGNGGDGGNGSNSSEGSTSPVPPSADSFANSFAITTSSGIGGTVSPSGFVLVKEGDNATIAIVPNDGFLISEVLVDGTNVGAVSSYTFENVTAAHTISATFKSAAYIVFDPSGTTIGDGGSGTMDASNNSTKSGYGFTASTAASGEHISSISVTADYNFTGSDSCALELVDGLWQFPSNAASPTGARKVYIPVDTADGTYGVTFTMTAIDEPASLIAGYTVYLTQSYTVDIIINGSMYDDYYTGDQH